MGTSPNPPNPLDAWESPFEPSCRGNTGGYFVSGEEGGVGHLWVGKGDVGTMSRGTPNVEKMNMSVL